MTHETLDQVKLAQQKLIAKKLQENPERILALARRNLQRYIKGRPATATYLWRERRTILEPGVKRTFALSNLCCHVI